MNFDLGWRIGFAFLIALLGCGKEKKEVEENIFTQYMEMKRQIQMLLAENSALRGALVSFQPWQNTLQTKSVGGSGGLVPFVRICPKGEAMSGVYGRSGSLVDALGPICRQINTIAQSFGSELQPIERELEVAGGGGGSVFTRKCPEGAFIVGVKGRAGEVIDNLAPLCKGLDDTSHPIVLPQSGGEGGQPFERKCPDQWVVVGISGRYDRHINSIALICGKVSKD